MATLWTGASPETSWKSSLSLWVVTNTAAMTWLSPSRFSVDGHHDDDPWTHWPNTRDVMQVHDVRYANCDECDDDPLPPYLHDIHEADLWTINNEHPCSHLIPNLSPSLCTSVHPPGPSMDWHDRLVTNISAMTWLSVFRFSVLLRVHTMDIMMMIPGPRTLMMWCSLWW